MKVLLAQLSPDQTVELNAERASQVILDNPEAEIAVFPELYLSGYRPSDAVAVSSRLGDAALAQIPEACREAKTAAVIGFSERLDGDADAAANSAACFDNDGSLAGVYRKTHLFGSDEETNFTPGESLCIVNLAGRRVAPLICFDVEFPEPARQLADAGAELLVTISANMEPYFEDHELASRSRALENRLPHLYVNRVGTESGHTFVGGSRVVDRDGRVVAALGDEQGVLVADLELDRDPLNEDIDYLRHVRRGLPVEEDHKLRGGER